MFYTEMKRRFMRYEKRGLRQKNAAVLVGRGDKLILQVI